MSPRSIPRSRYAVQRDSTFALPFPIIECGNLTAFLDLLSPTSTVLLMPIRHRVELGDSEITLAVQVTAQVAGVDGSAILTATFLAAACTLLGHTGSLLVPCEERGKPAEYVLRRAHDLQEELLTCLGACLSDHPHISHVRYPARYCIPNEWVWRPASLADSGIAFILGHWSRPVEPPDAGAVPFDQSLA